MTDLTDCERRQVDFLLADFSAIKAEISRRSTLQRIVLFGYIAVWVLLFQQASSSFVPGRWVVAVWVAATLSFQFFARERLEIHRLGDVIRKRIAPVASDILGIPAADLIPSQVQGDPAMDETRSLRRRYNRTFTWVIFFAAPVFATLLYGVEHRQEVHQLWRLDTPTPWAAFVVVLNAGYACLLLRRHA